jgi:hypothetical protein
VDIVTILKFALDGLGQRITEWGVVFQKATQGEKMAKTAKAKPMSGSLPETDGSEDKPVAEPTITELNELAKHLSALVDLHVAEETDSPVASATIAAARAAAVSLIKDRQSECGTSSAQGGVHGDAACNAIAKFQKAGRLNTSGVDIMATAFLTPACLFKEKSRIYDGNEHFLAAEFNLPLSAIVLRKKMLNLYSD